MQSSSIQLEDGPVPLYFQLVQHLLSRIQSGEFPVDSALPGEEQLCTDYGVSRTTVRRAMDDLIARQLVERRRGLGTFVIEPPKIRKVVRMVDSVLEALHYIQGLNYEDIVASTVSAPPEIAKWLRIAAGERVVFHQAVGMFEGKRITHLKLYYPQSIGRHLDTSIFQERSGMIRALERKLGQNIVRVEHLIEPEAADQACSKALGIAEGTPVLKSTRVFFLRDGRPVEVAVAHYHPEEHKLHVELIEQTRT